MSEDLRRTYVNSCTALTDALADEDSLIPQLRHVTEEAPAFRPAWAQLLTTEAAYASAIRDRNEEAGAARAALARDAAAARKVDPSMAEATLADLQVRGPLPPGQAMAIVDRAKSQDPQNPVVLVARAAQLGRVGSMTGAFNEAVAANKLDPLSPNTRVNLIYATLFAGQVDRARIELAAAKRLWPDSSAVREAEYELELRYGADFEKISRDMGYIGPGFQIYLNARRDPGPAPMGPYMAFLRRPENAKRLFFGLQGLGETNRPDQFYQLLAEVGDGGSLTSDPSLLFRPWMASVRRDPRFMPLAKRLGLVDYWRKSGKWPDFCADAQLRYDCQTEAAKLK